MVVTASAPAKAILFGEHAVVYGHPAVAVPLPEIRAYAEIAAAEKKVISVMAPDIQLNSELSQLAEDNPIRYAVDLFYRSHDVKRTQGMAISLHSGIPIASGMGSGAAASTALIKALFEFHHASFSTQELSEMVYEVEKLHHGTPSGIDNTVICYEQAVLFRKGWEIQPLTFEKPFHLVIADSGLSTPTRETVADVRRLHESHLEATQQVLVNIEVVTQLGLRYLQIGSFKKVGDQMNLNHDFLCQLGVSNETLDQLAKAATTAGAYGAKLSGGGRGGIVIALVEESNIPAVKKAMLEAGAVKTFHTEITSS